MTTSRTTGRGWAYLGALLGGAASIAANVAHSYVPPEAAPPGWAPQSGAVIGAVFWPLALFVAVEIFARTAWPAGRRWVLLRFAGLLPVAGVAAVVSYRHLSGLLSFYNDDALTVLIGPLAVDGLMVMATGALIATGTRRAGAVAAATRPAVNAAPAPAGPAAPVTPVTPPAAAKAALPVPAVPAMADEPTAPARPTGSGRPPAARAAKRQPSAAERVAKAAARSPQASPAQLAARLGLSERTVQRHMPKPPATTPAAGEPVASLKAVAA
ncbi:MAG TPA: hypothetical protein VFM55_19570 [Micromonosporaceae bacterium]|nr:hypothetical protein [Micromonosporaceae bacterium]